MLAKYPGATFVRVETDSDGVYEAHVTKADGTEVAVEVDKSFAVTGVEQGGLAVTAGTTATTTATAPATAPGHRGGSASRLNIRVTNRVLNVTRGITSGGSLSICVEASRDRDRSRPCEERRSGVTDATARARRSDHHPIYCCCWCRSC